MKKDFLVFTCKKAWQETFIFESLRVKGHSVDIVDESNFHTFKPIYSYKNVIVYPPTHLLTQINNIIDNYYRDSFIIQHDTTDYEHVQRWTNIPPNLVMQREYTEETINPYDCPIYGMHFPMPSIYDASQQQKIIDVSFMATMTNLRRKPFAEKVLELANDKLSHLNWHVVVTPQSVRTPEEFKRVANSSKIGLHYFGNSYDSVRVWELASTKTAIVMPKLRLKSTMDEHMPFKEYCEIKNDFSDLEEKIMFLLDNDRWKDYANRAYADYNDNHTPQKCFDKYYETIMRYAKK